MDDYNTENTVYNFEKIDYITDQMIKLYALEGKRITEQMMELDILADIEQIRIEEIGYINDIKHDVMSYIAEHKRELIKAFSEHDGFRAALQRIAMEINETNSNAVESVSEDAISEIDSIKLGAINTIETISETTEKEINEDIITMVVNNGYELKVIDDDGNGNITVGIVKEAI